MNCKYRGEDGLCSAQDIQIVYCDSQQLTYEVCLAAQELIDSCVDEEDYDA